MSFLAKAALRNELKNRLSSMKPEERIHQSKIIAKKILESSAYQNSQRVCLYLNMKEEVSTMEILADVLKSGRTCFIPRYTKDEMQMLRLYSMADFDNLPLTKWNIKQPLASDEREEALQSGGLDLILIPGLGFTENGHRLGRGKGYYDRYLSKVQATQATEPILMGLAFTEQIVHTIPVTEYDLAVHHVIHPDFNH